MPEEIWFYLAIIFGVATVALITLFLIERERKRGLEGSVRNVIAAEKILSGSRSVPENVIGEVRGKLRVLDVEREILSYALRRLYEAQAEGKITPEEREAMAKKYREDLERVREEIARGESIIALNELERMREEFIKTFSERLEVINRKIEELKVMAGLKTIEQAVKPVKEEIKIEGVGGQASIQQEQAERAPAPPVQRRRRETVKPKAVEGGEGKGEAEEKAVESIEREEADRSIEKIVAEIEKVLSRLNQIEVEE